MGVPGRAGTKPCTAMAPGTLMMLGGRGDTPGVCGAWDSVSVGRGCGEPGGGELVGCGEGDINGPGAPNVPHCAH